MNPAASSRVSTLIIQTPEGISFSLPLACPVTRCLAWAVDLSCIIGLTTLAGSLLHLTSLINLDLSRALTTLAYFALQIGYGMTCEWLWRGQTVGKRLLGLRVMDAQGLRLQFNQVALRNLLRFVDSLPIFYLVGGLVSLLNSRAQRLGDLVANTIVVRHIRLPEPDIDQLMAGKYNSLRDYPHLEARLRQRVTPAEASLALQALVRRDQLDLQARLTLFDELATHFRSIVTFPPEACEGIAAEQYIRNVVDVLFRSQNAGNRVLS
ncbi:MAG TPA: RDD family protein [Candidatus Saccharimonadales bacterium]|nr:RDD family protein [Candidatus Saccharimonadales bacterium]